MRRRSLQQWKRKWRRQARAMAPDFRGIHAMLEKSHACSHRADALTRRYRGPFQESYCFKLAGMSDDTPYVTKHTRPRRQRHHHRQFLKWQARFMVAAQAWCHETDRVRAFDRRTL